MHKQARTINTAKSRPSERSGDVSAFGCYLFVSCLCLFILLLFVVLFCCLFVLLFPCLSFCCCFVSLSFCFLLFAFALFTCFALLVCFACLFALLVLFACYSEKIGGGSGKAGNAETPARAFLSCFKS